MQQHRSRAAVGRAHIELNCLRISRWPQSHAPLLRRQVARERYLWGLVGNFADCVADDEFAIDQRQPRATGHHRVGRVKHFVEPGARPKPQRGQRARRASRRDQVIGARRQPALAKQARRAHKPPADSGCTRVFEHVRVPPWAAHARAVAGGRRQPPIGPRHPRHAYLHLGQTAQRACIDRGRRQRLAQCGHMPGTTYDCNPFEAITLRASQCLTHVRLAACFAQRPRLEDGT